MKCTLCNERNGNTRCEGCNTLFCLPCMSKHHDELTEQFQLLMDIRNEVKQSLDINGSTQSKEKPVSCINEIDKWEEKMIQRIQQIATKARMNVNEIILKHMNEVSHRFEELSVEMQQHQKDGSYIENDIERVKGQLNQLKNDIKQVNEKIRVDFTMSKDIEWDALIYIVEQEPLRKIMIERVETEDKNPKEEDMSTSKVAAKRVGHSLIPVQRTKPPASSSKQNLTISEPTRNTTAICLVCDRPFHSTQFKRICSECYPGTQYSNSDNVVSNRLQSRLQSRNMYLPAYDSSNTPVLKTTAPSRVTCPCCTNPNLVDNWSGESVHYCGACRNPMSSSCSSKRSDFWNSDSDEVVQAHATIKDSD